MSFIKAATSFSEVCSTSILRSFNGVLALLCSVLVHEIITHLRPALDERKATLYAVVMALYPLHWFFTFLYYTDVASLGAVLAMYLACLKKKYWFSALVKAQVYSISHFIIFEHVILMQIHTCTDICYTYMFVHSSGNLV